MDIPLERYAFESAPVARKATFGIRPEHVIVGDSARGEPFHAQATVEMVETMGADAQLWLSMAGQGIRSRIDGQMDLAPGTEILVGFDPARASLFDADTENRL